MDDLYEFRVTGTIGPVIRSAIPELTSCRTERSWVLTGDAVGPADIARVLRLLEKFRIVETDIHVRRVTKSCPDDTQPTPRRGAPSA